MQPISETIKLVRKLLGEQADFDQAQYTPDELHTYDKQEFSDRGRGDLKARPNNPRFADNSMADSKDLLSEFAGQSQIDQLYQILSKAGISDQQIRGDFELAQSGKEKVAGELGISADDVDIYVHTLQQQLRNEKADSEELTLTEQYYNAVNAIDEDDETSTEEAGQSDPPFNEGRYSYEPDALGSVTVRDATTGKSSFVQGAAANKLLAQLKSQSGNEDALLAPLVEEVDDTPTGKQSFWGEIKADAGSYNFLWKLGGQHGTGTVMFHADNGPDLQLVDVRNSAGDEIDVNPVMHKNLLQQARDFLGKE